MRSAEAPLHHDTPRAARRVFESFTPDLEIAFAHRIGYRHAQAPLRPTSKPGARDRDGVSSLIHFRRRSCSMDIAQFAGGSQHPVALSCQPRQKARAVRVCGNHTWYPELKTARARSSYGRCIRRSGQRPGGSLGATPADQARLNPSVKPELAALTPQRAAWLSAVVDADEHPANPPSSKLAATCHVRHCRWRIQAPAMGLS